MATSLVGGCEPGSAGATRTKATRAPGSVPKCGMSGCRSSARNLSVAASTVSSWFRGNHVDTEGELRRARECGDKQPMSQSDAVGQATFYDQEAGRQVPRLQVSVLPSG